MIIRKLRMVNFRGFHDKTIDFNNKSVVLLSAANGVGKTTTIDAIEWCLTGDIGRLKTAFDARSTNVADRKQNTNGILKNRDSDNSSTIQVLLWIVEGEDEKILCREQKKDELNSNASEVTIDGSEDVARLFIDEYVGDSFYNFHFCDVQKSFNVQNAKRIDLESFFSEFITNYDEQKQIAENMDLFADDVERYIEDKVNQKVSQEMIKTQEDQLAKMQEEAKQILYPETTFYADENVEIVQVSREKLIEQKAKVENCAYLIAEKEIHKLIENDSLKSQLFLIKEISSFFEKKEISIRRAVSAGLFNNMDTITALESELSEWIKLSFTKKSIFQDAETVITCVDGKSIQMEFEVEKSNIQEKEKKIISLSSEIDLLTENNKMLKLLSTLSANKAVVIEHRNTTFAEKGIVRCPVCGSETFATMDESLILKEADDYIKRNGELVKLKESEKTILQVEIETLYQKMISRAKTIVEKEKSRLEAKIGELKDLNNELRPYFDAVRKLQKNRKEIIVEELDSEKMKILLTRVENQILPETKEKEVRELYQKILTVLGYTFANETVQQTYEKMRNLITKSYEVTNFSYEMFVTKINAIDSVLANQALTNLSRKLENDRKKNQKLDTEINKLLKLKNDAIQKAQNIRNIVEELSQDEYEKIGPALKKFYNKLIRIDDNDGINIVHENDGISLVDDKGKNIVNVLSNGQISVFMLAYFFAGINARNEREKMKIFFVDDLTACMDDVNMLAFIDLLKYQMSSKKTMEQLFFVTCDNRISRLLKYKMNGREIGVKELLEADFA